MIARTLHDRHFGWDNSLEPIAEIESGEQLEFDVIDASGGQLVRSSAAPALLALDFAKVNPLTGPVYVKGARPGHTLEVEIRSMRMGDWGWTGIIPGFGLLADEHPDAWLQIWRLDGRIARGLRGVTVPMRPFPGTIGVALAEVGAHSVVPPRRSGGNMDIKHLTEGVKLYLPVFVEGALFSVGDTHAAQGDGEVCGTAIEAPSTIALRFRLIKDRTIAGPRYNVPAASAASPDPMGYRVTTGIADDLREAARCAVREMIALLGEDHGFSPNEAYALASVAVDLRISEVVDAPNWLVSAVLPNSIFAA
jgi:acetamidase/formamidase